MTHLQRVRLSKREATTAQWIGTPIVLIWVVLIKLLWRAKRLLMILALASFVMYGFSSISVRAESPKANLTAPIVNTPEESEHEQIKSYIRQVFGDQATNAFKILACENHGLNPNAQGHNDNGTVDTGIFQVNSIWANPVLLTDWHTNVDIAHQIYLRGGWGEWACEYVWHALERSDTI